MKNDVMRTKCLSVNIQFRDHNCKEYRIGTNSDIEMKDLLKNEIDNINKACGFDNMISVEFTGYAIN